MISQYWGSGDASSESPPGTDNRAMTPIIGIILLVAIAVILASVIGMFVFGLVDHRTNPSPHVSFTYDYDEKAGEVTITHESGDEFERENVHFMEEDKGELSPKISWPTTVQAGDSTTVAVAADVELRIVWEDPRQQDSTAVIGSWKGPEA